MVELLKQGTYKPLDVTDQTLLIYAGTKGFLDDVPVKSVQAWESQFLRFMSDQKPEVRKALADKKELTNEIVEMIESSLKEFGAQFKAGQAHKPVLAKV